MRKLMTQDPVYCSGCPLYRNSGHKTTYVPTDVYYSEVGEDEETPKVDVLVIGESVSRVEDNVGLPFAGDAGAEIKSALAKAGITDSFALSNIVRCRPTEDDGSSRDPSLEEVTACSNYVKKDIEALQPKIVIYAGTQPLQALNPNPSWQGKGAGSLSGQIYKSNGKTHLVTVHPSSFIKSQNGPRRRKFHRQIKSVHSLLTGEETKWSRKGKVIVCDTKEKVDEAISFFLSECTKPVAFDFETQNLNLVASNKVATLQLSADADLAYVFPLQHWDSPWKDRAELNYVRKRLRKLFSSKSVKFPFWIAHNSQFDISIAIRFFRLSGFAKPVIDTQFLAYLQDENQVGSDDNKGSSEFNAFRLKDLARELLGFYLYDTELSDAMAARQGAQGGSLWDLSLDRLSEYGGTDAYITFRLFYYYKRWLDRQGYSSALKFALRWYGRISFLLSKMTMAGFHVDKEQLDFLLSDSSPIITRLDEIPKLLADSKQAKVANDLVLGDDPRTKGMRPLFGKKPWVLDLDKKLHKVHFFVGACGLAPLSHGKDGKPSINKAFFEEYEDHPLIALYQEYSGLYKLRSSYLNSVGDILFSKPDNSADGRIHAGFHAIRTVTGRLSSSNPNLQQLPKGNPWTAKAFIRSMYGARPGYMLIECDYGQAEVRWWAQISGDTQYASLFSDMKALREEYKKTGDPVLGKRVAEECDIHRKVAAIMFRKPLASVTKDERKKAKSLCFGAVYGQHYKTLASLLGITPDKALELQDTFIKEFPRAGRWLTEIEDYARLHGVVSSPMERRRHLADLFALDEGAGSRRARNSPIQAVSSDTTALAAWRIMRWIEENNRPYHVINCVHDAITLEIPIDLAMAEEAVWLFNTMMVDTIPDFLREEFGIKMIVPMEIDFDFGVRWGHMLGYDGVASKLPSLVQSCSDWSAELAAGTPWHEIAAREAVFQDPERKDAAA